MVDCKLILGVFLLSLACCNGMRRMPAWYYSDVGSEYRDMQEARYKAQYVRRMLRRNPEAAFYMDGVGDTLQEGREAAVKARMYESIFGRRSNRRRSSRRRSGNRHRSTDTYGSSKSGYDSHGSSRPGVYDRQSRRKQTKY